MPRTARKLQRRERGQAAILLVLSLLFLSMFFALGLDAGLFFWGHRSAQNQADAGALAAAALLPSNNATLARAATLRALQENGIDNAAVAASCLLFADNFGEDGLIDTVRVCVRRPIPAVFARLFGVQSVYVSATAVAAAGPATVAPVKPWALIAPDPTCQPNATCRADLNGNGNLQEEGDCDDVAFQRCPWGLNTERLYAFHATPLGNTAAIEACGANGYLTCVMGTRVSPYFEETAPSSVEAVSPAKMGTETRDGLSGLSGAACDVAATPDGRFAGFDADGKALAVARYVNGTGCEDRVVVVPLLSRTPDGGSTTVLGLATFAIAGWHRSGPLAPTPRGSASGSGTPCRTSPPVPGPSFDCGFMWGYLLTITDRSGSARPPTPLLQKFGASHNPLAPVLVAVIE